MKKLGIAFGGGGGRGAYHIGVWKALKETGLDRRVAAISGTSVGALNGALFLQGDWDRAHSVWLSNIGPKVLLPQPSTEKALKGLSLKNIQALAASIPSEGAFSREGLLEIIEGHINLHAIWESPIPFTIACVRAQSNKLEYVRLNLRHPEIIKLFLCATSAIPLIFPPEKINGVLYMDGGIPVLGDNCPIKPLADEGCDTIIALPLDRLSNINADAYPYTRIVEILPSNALWGAASAIDGLLDFRPKAVEKRIRLGYEDAMKALWRNHLTDIIAFKAPVKKKPKK